MDKIQWFTGPWTMFSQSTESMDNVHWVHGQCPLNPWTLSSFTGFVHGLTGLCPECPWTLSRLSTESMVNVHWSMDNVQGVHWVHGLSTDGLNSPKQLTSTLVHILSPVTDNCPTWISSKERMAVAMTSCPISMKECIARPKDRIHDHLNIRQMRIWPSYWARSKFDCNTSELKAFAFFWLSCLQVLLRYNLL